MNSVSREEILECEKRKQRLSKLAVTSLTSHAQAQITFTVLSKSGSVSSAIPLFSVDGKKQIAR